MTVVRAPGRVNLIGEHTDYSDGFCLPVAIDRECRIESAPLDAPVVRARSRQVAEPVEIAIEAQHPYAGPRWGRFVDAAVRVIHAAGHPVTGCAISVDSSVPTGTGLSSSSAFSVALILTLLPDDAPERGDPRVLARLALDIEVVATGVPGGLLDQMASLCGRAGHALLLDCRDLSIEPIPIPDELALLVVDSGIPRELADSEYAARRRACEDAAARIGVPALRDATLQQVGSDPIARHVVSENQRVLDCAAALRSSDLARVGEILLAGHASLADDFSVSTPELDLLVSLLVEHGALGARLTGAGFGGCVVAVLAPADVHPCLAATLPAYRAATGRGGSGFRVHAAAGAGSVPPRPISQLKP